jgi:hypothetical protein
MIRVNLYRPSEQVSHVTTHSAYLPIPVTLWRYSLTKMDGAVYPKWVRLTVYKQTFPEFQKDRVRKVGDWIEVSK